MEFNDEGFDVPHSAPIPPRDWEDIDISISLSDADISPAFLLMVVEDSPFWFVCNGELVPIGSLQYSDLA